MTTQSAKVTIDRLENAYADAKRAYVLKADNIAENAGYLAQRLLTLAAQVRDRAQGRATIFNTLGEVQGRGAELDRMVGELATQENELSRIRWVLGRGDEPLFGDVLR